MEMSTSAGGGNGSPSQNVENKESKRPSNSAFKQQRLTAWQPILTAGTVLPTFFVIGILFIPVGIGLWFFSENVKEITIAYTHCISTKENRTCADILKENSSAVCHCEVPFTLDTQFSPRVFMYYALTNFYQNHRRYVKSRDDSQLWGETGGDPNGDCVPFAKDKNLIIYPCGAIANSMFSDEISLTYHRENEPPQDVSLIRTGIAWDSDKRFKFKNPPNYGENSSMWRTHTKPKAWRKHLYELDPENPENNGIQNEDLIVWMRTAALPNFRKLYRIVNATAKYFIGGGLPVGNYSLKISYTYEVESFHGAKSIVLSTTSLLGGKNPFLGISYIVVGTICLILGVLFLFIHINYGKSTWEMTNVDPRTPWIAN